MGGSRSNTPHGTPKIGVPPSNSADQGQGQRREGRAPHTPDARRLAVPREMFFPRPSPSVLPRTSVKACPSASAMRSAYCALTAVPLQKEKADTRLTLGIGLPDFVLLHRQGGEADLNPSCPWPSSRPLDWKKPLRPSATVP